MYNNPMSKTIIYIMPRFHPFKGGAEQHVLSLAKRLASIQEISTSESLSLLSPDKQKGELKQNDEYRFKVKVFTTDIKFNNETLEKFEIYKNIEIHRLHAWNRALIFGFYPALLIRLLLTRAHYIHLSGFGFIWRDFCVLLKKVFSPGTKILITPHGPFMPTRFNTYPVKTLKLPFIILVKLYVKLYYRFFAVVESQKKWLTKDYGVNTKKIVVTPNGIDPDYIEHSLQNLHKAPLKLSYVNRFEEYKGIHKVLEAMYLLKSKDSNFNIHFIIAGRKGDYYENVINLIQKYNLQNNTEIILSPTDVQRDEIYRNSHFHILPSQYEATGITLLEAMAKGCGIITTYQNDAWDMLIKEDVSGYVYDFNDVKKLSEILLNLSKNTELVNKIRMNNLKFAVDFTWDKSFESYLEVLNTK